MGGILCGLPIRPLRDWSVIAFVVVSLVLARGSFLNAQESEADGSRTDGQEALKQIQAWRKSFATIQVHWRDWHRQDFIDYNPGIDPDEALGKTDGSQCEFAWADFGATRKQMTVLKRGKAVFRDASGTPGNRPWGADSKYGESVERWDHIQFYRPDANRPLSSNFVMKGIFGLWNGRGHWFSDGLTGAGVEFVGYEEVNGHRCLVAKHTTEQRGDTYWLDPEQHYLPRQYRVTGPAKDGGKVWYTWIVAEFQVLENGMPFPASGNLLEVDQGPPGFTWIIDRVVLNESLPRSFFEAPKPQVGTRITDYDKMEAHQSGPKTSAAVPDAKRTTAPNNSPVVARPESFPWSWLAVVAAVILAGGVLMRWWQRSRYGAAFALALLGLSLASTSILSAEEPRADELTANGTEAIKQMQQWRRSFATIQVHWRRWHRQLFMEKNPKLDPDQVMGKIPYAGQEFVWADWGAFRHASTSYKDGLATFRDAMGTPGDRPWSVTTKYGEDVDHWDHLQFYRPVPDRPLSANIAFTGMYGLWNSSGFWFSDVLAQAQNTEFGGYEEIDGHRCLLAKVTEEKRQATYWLDPEQRFLPRQYRIVGQMSGPDSNNEVTHWYTWTVAEFQALEHGLPFPARGNLVCGSENPPGFEWIIERVVLNESLPRSFFEAPKPQAGTRITDYDKMEAYLAGPKTAAVVVPDTQKATAQHESPAVARPRLFPWSWVALIAAIVLAGGVLMRWWQRSRDQ